MADVLPRGKRANVTPLGEETSSRSIRMIFQRMSDHEEQMARVARVVDEVKETLGALQSTAATMVTLLGEEKEDGQGNILSTGLLGRMRRIENTTENMVKKYERWIAFGSGFFLAASVLIAALWWVIGDRMSHLLRLAGAT